MKRERPSVTTPPLPPRPVFLRVGDLKGPSKIGGWTDPDPLVRGWSEVGRLHETFTFTENRWFTRGVPTPWLQGRTMLNGCMTSSL